MGAFSRRLPKPAIGWDSVEMASVPADNGRMDPSQEHEPVPGPNASEVDLGEMERQIEALLDGGPAEGAATGAATAERSVRDEALESEPIDPLLKEIDAALADDADALLRGSQGDIDGAVRSVFDERALTGQEEEINRALIEAFGTSRVERPSFAAPSVTNPLPGFEGAARPLPPDIPREERDREPAAIASSMTASLEGDATAMAETATSAMRTVATTDTTAPATAPEPIAVAAPEPTRAAPQPTEAAPRAATTDTAQPMRSAGFLMHAALTPLRILAAPVRMLPIEARPIMTIAAITLLACAPVAWWLAQRAAATPLVGPINILPAPAVVAAEPSSGH